MPDDLELPEIQIPFATDLTTAHCRTTGPMSTEPYVSPEFFELERKQVFGRAWLAMGRIEQLPKANSYIVREVEVAKASVLITRDAEGNIRAFHNVCPHRGSAVAHEKCGVRNRFTCRYHGWTFRNDGSLMGVPDEEMFFDFDKSKLGLTQLACDVWEGWIFINFQKQPEISLKEFLGDLGEAFKGIQYLNSHQAVVIDARFDANWKLIADAFAEGYHVNFLHPNTLAPSYSSDKNRTARPIHGRAWGIHRSLSVFGNVDYVTPTNSKVERLANLNVTNVLAGDTGEEVERLLNHPEINPSGSPHWSADITWLFPNFDMDFSGGGFWSHEFWPTAYNKTHWTARIYVPTATSWRERLAQEHYTARWADIVLEDVSNCETIQKGMESGAIDSIVLQDGEFMIRHSLETINRWVEAKTVREAVKDD